MNDISNRPESHAEEHPSAKRISGSPLATAKYQKLQATLVLLYQSYLKKEVELEPYLRMALWRMAQFNEDFKNKICQLQLAILQKMPASIPDRWEASKNILFPFGEHEIEANEGSSDDTTIATYKETVRQLLGNED